MSAESETVAFAEGEGVGETAGRAIERADAIAYLERKRANAERMVARSPEFEDELRWIVRQLTVVIDDMRAGLHEGESVVGVAATAASAAYPFVDHRTVAQADASAASSSGHAVGGQRL